MVRTSEGNQVYLRYNFKFEAAIHVNKCHKQIELPHSLKACATSTRLPPNICIMGGTHFMFFITVFTEVRGGIKPSLYEGQIQRDSGAEVKSMYYNECRAPLYLDPDLKIIPRLSGNFREYLFYLLNPWR